MVCFTEVEGGAAAGRARAESLLTILKMLRPAANPAGHEASARSGCSIALLPNLEDIFALIGRLDRGNGSVAPGAPDVRRPVLPTSPRRHLCTS